MNIQTGLNWRPPENWDKITVIDAHTGGEPLRVILGGYPKFNGKTILEKRREAITHYDHLRTALMWEPRGHADMYGCIVTPPVSKNAHFGVLFTHNEGYSSMCGHGIIAVTTVVLETGIIQTDAPVVKVRIDSPAGLVTAFAKIKNGRVASVAFQNVPSYVDALDEVVEVPGLGNVRYDLAYGGAFYAFVRAEDADVKCAPEGFQRLIERGMKIKRAIMATRKIEHPFEADLGFLYGTIFIGPAESPQAHSRNVCIFAEGEVDRSPTGTGVSARTAIHHARGEIGLNEKIEIESIIGSSFTGKVMKEIEFGPHKAVVPEVEGRAFITGKCEFWIDPDDPLKNGFILR